MAQNRGCKAFEANQPSTCCLNFTEMTSLNHEKEAKAEGPSQQGELLEEPEGRRQHGELQLEPEGRSQQGVVVQ